MRQKVTLRSMTGELMLTGLITMFLLFSCQQASAQADCDSISGKKRNKCWIKKAKSGVKDLKGADLSGAKLKGVDLSGADLSDAKLTKAKLTGADLSGADLTGADLTKANLTHSKLINAKLNDADLTKAILNGADLNGADLTGTILTGADLSGWFTGKATVSQNTKGIELKEWQNLGGGFRVDCNGFESFEDQAAKRACWQAEQERKRAAAEAVAAEQERKRAVAKQPNPQAANCQIISEPAMKRYCWIQKAKSPGGFLASFRGADLSGVNLSGVNLSGADLTGADLTKANLTGANFWGANLSGAIFIGADLSGADLTEAILTNAIVSRETRGVDIVDWVKRGGKGVN